MIFLIPINMPLIGNEEKDEVMKVLESSQLTNASIEGGHYTQKFQSSVKSFLNVKHVFAINSGTSSLYAALLSIGIKEGDEVLVPSFTFLATANVVLLTGAKPVFVDIDMAHYTIDPNDLKNKISTRSKAVIPVHLFGHPADMNKITEIAKKHDLRIIEDASQSLGAKYHERQTGSLSDIGCFSMYPSKIITSGEGGFVSTNDDALAENLKLIRNHGISQSLDAKVLGANLRLPQMEAAIAYIQMSKLPSFLKVRQRNAGILTDMLSGLNGAKLPGEAKDCSSNWYLYTVASERNRDKILKYLFSHKVGAAVYYDPPIHKTPLYAAKGYNQLILPNTDNACKHVLSLPVHPGVSEDDMIHIASTFRSAFKSAK